MLNNRIFTCSMSAFAVMALAAPVHAFAAEEQAAEPAPAAGTDNSQGGAQSDTARGVLVEDIVVTANKREQNLQDVPISITAFSGDQLEALGFKNGYDLVQQTPGFVISQFGRNHPISYTTIRGIGAVDSNPFNDPSVSYYVDEVYQAASFAGNQQVYDLERAEVLKGPQGTLFGRNATGGLVHFITKKPTEETDGYLRLRLARFGERVVEGALGGSIAPGFRLRTAIQYSANDGIDKNPVTGENRFGANETFAGRVTAAVDLGPDAELMVSVHGYRGEGYRRGVKFFGQRNPTTGNFCGDANIAAGGVCSDNTGYIFPPIDNTTTVYPYRPPLLNGNGIGGYARLTWDLGGVELVALSGYEKARSHLFADCYGATGVANLEYCAERDVRRESYSQELRLGSDGDWGSWVVGAYYFNDTASQTGRTTSVPYNLATQYSFGSSVAKTDSYAAFAQVEYQFVDQLRAIGGLRITHDKRNFEYNLRPDTANLSATKLTGKAALQWEPSDDVMIYGQYSRGYKSGGFGAAFTNNVAKPESVDAFELGLKSNFADNRVKLNGAAFYYDFRGLQIQAQDIDRNFDPPRPVTGFVNLDKIRLYGFDLDFSAQITDNFSVSLGGEYLNSRITDIDLIVDRAAVNGNDAPNSPNWAATGIVRYDIPTDTAGLFTLQSDFRWTDSYFTSASNRVTHKVDAYAVFNFRILWESADSRISGSIFLENAFDKVYASAIFASPTRASGDIPFWSRGFVDTGTPRTWGAEVKYKF